MNITQDKLNQLDDSLSSIQTLVRKLPIRKDSVRQQVNIVNELQRIKDVLANLEISFS